jgi:glycerol-3-phosphate dehydrogenase
MIYYGGTDGRVCLAYPFFDHVLVGSTDIPIEDPDSAVCGADEIAYMLSTLREVFPDIAITAQQVIYHYAGVRPLPQSDAAKPGEVTRDHSLPQDRIAALPIYSMIGGKWTTFRAFAAETTDTILASLGSKRRQATTFEPIGGGRGFPQSAQQRVEWIAGFSSQYGVTAAQSEILLERYGNAAHRIAKTAGKALSERLTSLPDYSRGEIEALIRDEQVVTVADIVFRRTSIAIAGHLSLAVIEDLAEIAGGALNWMAAECAREIEATLVLARDRHGVRFPEPATADVRPDGDREWTAATS